MADLKISQLSAVSEVQGTDVFPTVSGLATMKASAAQIKTYVTESLDVNDSAVAGSYVTAVSEADGVISVTREAADVKPTANSTKMLTSGGAKAALDEKQNTLTFDNTPTANSNNPVKSGGVYTEVNSLKETFANQSFTNGAVNLWENERASNVINGVTYVVNADKTITASRSEQGSTSIFYLVPNSTDFSDKRYKISGCPSGGSGSTYCIKVYKDGNTIAEDIGNGAVFTGTGITIAIVVFGQTTGTFLFKPMITLADMPNSDYAHYVPYAKSNKELTQDVEDLSNAQYFDFTTETSVQANTSAQPMTYTIDNDGTYRVSLTSKDVDAQNGATLLINGVTIGTVRADIIENNVSRILKLKKGAVITSTNSGTARYRMDVIKLS